MTRLTRNRVVSSVFALSLAAAGLPALAQEATPMASPEAGMPMELPPPPDWAEVVATGLAIDARGVLFVAVFGVLGEMGQVWRIMPRA